MHIAQCMCDAADMFIYANCSIVRRWSHPLARHTRSLSPSVRVGCVTRVVYPENNNIKIEFQNFRCLQCMWHIHNTFAGDPRHTQSEGTLSLYLAAMYGTYYKHPGPFTRTCNANMSQSYCAGQMLGGREWDGGREHMWNVWRATITPFNRPHTTHTPRYVHVARVPGHKPSSKSMGILKYNVVDAGSSIGCCCHSVGVFILAQWALSILQHISDTIITTTIITVSDMSFKFHPGLTFHGMHFLPNVARQYLTLFRSRI